MKAEKRAATVKLVETGLSIAKACCLIGLSRPSYYRKLKDWCEADSAVIDAIKGVLKRTPRAGFRKCYARIRRQGHEFNHKRVYRVYCSQLLQIRR